MIKKALAYLLLLNAVFLPLQILAQETTGTYLQYQEPKAPEISWLSSIAYIFSLLVTFGVILFLAYLASRFLGQKMGSLSAANGGRILSSLPLGANRAVQVVEIAGKVLVLGVTDHTIMLLQEITDETEIARLKDRPAVTVQPQFGTLFERHLTSLQNIAQKFPGVLDSRQENDRRKR